MKNLIVSALISMTVLSSAALAGGGSTSSVTPFDFRGLACQNAEGVTSKPVLGDIDLGNSQTLTLNGFDYDFFYIHLEFAGEINGCHVEALLNFNDKGLLVSADRSLALGCVEEQKALLSLFENTDLNQLEDSSAHITTRLSGETVCGDKSSKVIAVFGG